MLHITSIRDRLIEKFGDKVLFTEISKSQLVYVCWNPMPDITQSILKNATAEVYTDTNGSSRIYSTTSTDENKQSWCEKLVEVISLWREAAQENLHYLKRIQGNHESLAQFTTDLFWDCAPLVIKNFIGLLTSTEHDFRFFKKNYQFYKLYGQDFYKSSDKTLKISSIVYGIIGTRYTYCLTPKHVLLANEIFIMYDRLTY